METPTLKKEKVTLYFRGEMLGNIHRIEASAFAVRIGPYAQYPSAVFCYWIPKGARNVKGRVFTYRPDVLILAGHGNPEPDGIFQDAQPGNVEGVTVQRGRHSACSEGWAEDFNSKINPYIEAHPGIVKEDFRGHNPHRVAQPTTSEQI